MFWTHYNIDTYKIILYLSICDVDGQIYVTERSRSNFSDKLVLSTDYKLGFGATAACHNAHQMTISTQISLQGGFCEQPSRHQEFSVSSFNDVTSCYSQLTLETSWWKKTISSSSSDGVRFIHRLRATVGSFLFKIRFPHGIPCQKRPRYTFKPTFSSRPSTTVQQLPPSSS